MQAPLSFPATAASSLINGYCEDFVSLAASMAQTLEQVKMRDLPLDECRDVLTRVERGMRDLAEAIGGVLAHTAKAAPAARGRTAPGRRASKAGGKAPASAARPGASAGAPPRATPAPIRPPNDAERATPRRFDRIGTPDRPGPRAMPVAPAEALPPTDGAVRRPHQEPAKTPPSLDPTRVPPPPSVGSMLAGSNDTMPLRSVFQFLARMRKSGTLRVGLDTEEMSFDLGDGCLIATTSNRMQQNERLGDLLIELGFIAPMDLEVFVRMHGQSLRQLGGALAQAGRITEGQLAEALELQVARRFKRAVVATKATYDFRECPRPRGDGRIRIRAFEVMSGDQRSGDDADQE